MSDASWHFAERIMDLRVSEERRRADSRRLARIARADEISLARRARWFVAEAGFRLVAAGAWLETRVQAPLVAPERSLDVSR
jgi:hypothetical protein